MVRGKTTNGLMRHLRHTHGITIGGSKDKKDLLNMGYYHGYKGYRFIKKSSNNIPFTEFQEIVSIYQFDTDIKTIFYPNIMLAETAIKNYTLNKIISLGSADFDYVFSHLMNDYKKHPVGNKDYRTKMKRRLDLRNKIHQAVSYNYSEDKAFIQHYFHKNKPVPLWAIFEVISLGEFGFFIQCLNQSTRIAIAEDLKIHSTSHNQNGRILEDIIFLIKDLRNAVAHNSVVFDCRFSKSSPPSRLKEFITRETGINNITFETIIDYLVILVYLLKKLGVSKTELKRIIRTFSTKSEHLRSNITASVHTMIMGSDHEKKLRKLSSYV